MSHILESLRNEQYLSAAITSRTLNDVAIEPVFVASTSTSPPLSGEEKTSQRQLVKATKDLERHCTQVDLMSTDALVFQKGSDQLDLRYRGNESFLHMVKTLSALKQRVEQIPAFASSDLKDLKSSTIGRIAELRGRLDRMRLDAWSSQTAGAALAKDRGYHVVATDQYFPKHMPTSPTTLVCLVAAVAFHLLLNGTRVHSNYILGVLDIGITTALLEYASTKLPKLAIPSDLRTALQVFHLEPSLKTFICCPRCFALYTPDSRGNFPDQCTHRTSVSSPQCQAGLKKSAGKRKDKPVPHKVYQHQSITEWWGRMLSRPGIEAACEEYTRSSNFSASDNASDIWNATRLQQMRFRDGHTSITGPPEVGRYVFSMAIDWFLVDEAKVGRTKRSVGGIYACCQNLPFHLRYLKENMCLVGIIPGPKKTHAQTLNHFLDKIVDDFVHLYNGTWYTKTHQYPTGRLAYGMLGPVISDLDAARIIGGFTHHQHRRLCHCCHIERADIRNFNPGTFVPRTSKEHKDAARRWEKATSDSAKKAIYDATGVFWTPLQRLGYWDPTTDLIVDVMHNQFLGLAQEHCRRIWGMNVRVKGGQGTSYVLNKIPSKPEMILGWAALKAPLVTRMKELKDLPKDTLNALCVSCNLAAKLPQRAVKADMTSALFNWSTHNTPSESVSSKEVDYAKLLRVDRSKWHRLPSDLLVRCCTYEWEKLGEPTTAKPAFGKFTPTQLGEWITARIPYTEPRTVEDSQDDYTLLCTHPNRWKELPFPQLLRISNRYWSPGDPPLRLFRADLAAFLQGKRPIGGLNGVTIQIPNVKENQRRRAERTVLGSTLLDAVRQDNIKTAVPSWLSKAPLEMGTALQGVLSADQWRMVVTVHLPITLIMEWGFHPESTRPFQMLHHFMLLALLCSTITKRSTSKARRKLISDLSIEYLEKTVELFPNATIQTNHHLLFHIPRFLKLFGPPHSWWAFVYERLNGVLKRIHTNRRMGDIEKTIMLSFTRAANLRGLIRDRLLPESASRLYKFLEPWLGTSYNGTLEKETEAVGSRDMLVFPGRVLDDPAYQSWLYDGVKRKNNLKVVNRIRQLLAWEPNETQHCTHLFHRGATYAPVPDLGTAATCPEAGDSTIEYRTKEGTLVAGRIVHILHRGMLKAEAKASSNTKVVVQRYKALEQKDVSKDKFRLWSGFRAHLVLPQFSERLEVIDASDIIAHVATCPFRDPSGNIEGQFVVIWPLDRS